MIALKVSYSVVDVLSLFFAERLALLSFNLDNGYTQARTQGGVRGFKHPLWIKKQNKTKTCLFGLVCLFCSLACQRCRPCTRIPYAVSGKLIQLF